MPGPSNGLAGELLTNLDADLVAPPTDRRPEMDREFVRRETVARQRLNCLGRYLCHRTPPP